MRAKRLTMKYNNHMPENATPESLQADRDKMLAELLGKVGEGSCIEPPFHVDYGCNVAIGKSFYANVKYVCLSISHIMKYL
jgi:acetyltransferase-like isoleucine patch superfamily enzyme